MHRLLGHRCGSATASLDAEALHQELATGDRGRADTSRRTAATAAALRPRTCGESRRSRARGAYASLRWALLALLLQPLLALSASASPSREGSGVQRPERAAASVSYSVVSASVNTLRPKESDRADTNVAAANLMSKVEMLELEFN